MSEFYVEDLPEDIARTLIGDKYDPECVYQMVNDHEGLYISGYNRDTGEKVDLSERSDGIPDDMEISIEEARYARDEIDRLESEKFTNMSFGYYWIFVVLAIILAVGLMVVGLFLVLRR